jgi:gluconate kinase
LFKNSKSAINQKVKAKLDSGYQGILELHANSDIPKKKTKKYPLSDEEKQLNKQLASERIYIEHINRRIKRFKILSSRYRSRRRYHCLRVSLICGLYNYELVG